MQLKPILAHLKVNDLWLGDQWDEVKIGLVAEEEGLSEEIVGMILQTPFDRGGRDRGRWKLAGNGDFSTASAWNLERKRAGRRLIFELTWSKGIGLSISIFLWRLLANRIPVDAEMEWKGISLASKCRYCENPQIESRLYLFVNGIAARRVWQHFARWFPKVPLFEERGDNLELRFWWWQRHMGIRTGHHLCNIIPCLILWFLWSERNENVHRDKPFEVENVIRRVNAHLRNLVLAKVLGPDQWSGCCLQLEVMVGEPRAARRWSVGRVQWRPPDVGWLKLNVDGAFSEASQRVGVGGVLRDQQGDFIVAFAAGFAGSSSLEAEVAAVLQGVILAKQHGCRLWVESDADTVVRWISSGQLGPAEVCTDLLRIRHQMQDVEWKISHIFREGNKAADFLAGLGLHAESQTIFTSSSAPARVRALCRLDQMGLPNFRF